MTDSAAEGADYGMDSDEGNARLQSLLAEVRAQVQAGEIDRREAVVLLADGVEELSGAHPEVTEVTVRTAIVEELDPAFTGEQWERLEPFEF